MNRSNTRRTGVWFAIIGVIVCAIVCVCGCDPATAGLTEPTTYSKHGITFKHPKNWTVEAEVHTKGVISLDVDTVGNAVFLVLVQPEIDAPSLAEYATNMAQGEARLTPSAMRSKFSSLEADPSNDNRLTQKMSITGLGVTVPHQREYRRIISSDLANKRVAFLQWQSAVEDANETAQGAKLIFDSFRFTKEE